MNKAFLIFAVVAVVYIGVALYIVFPHCRKAIKVFKKLILHFDGHISLFSFLRPFFHGKYKGLKFYIYLDLLEVYQPQLSICLEIEHNFKLVIYKIITKTSTERLAFKMLYMAGFKKIELFDNNFLAYSNKPEFVKTYLTPQKENLLKSIFDEGFYELYTNMKRIFIRKFNYDLESDLELNKVVSILDRLCLF